MFYTFLLLFEVESVDVVLFDESETPGEAVFFKFCLLLATDESDALETAADFTDLSFLHIADVSDSLEITAF